MEPMRALMLLLASFAAMEGQTVLTPEEIAQGWVMLFDGESLFGWTAVGDARWQVTDSVLVAESGSYGWLRHNAVFSDFELAVEFRSAANGNSGVFLRAAPSGNPHISGYELQICDTHSRYPTGSIVSHAPAKDGSIRAGEWQRFHVIARGPLIQVSLDGKPLVGLRDGKAPVGHIGLQYSAGKKIEFRNIRLRPLGLQPMVEAKSLRGWTTVEPAKRPEAPAKWSAVEGGIHVEKGPGHLETERMWRNFVLQMEIRTNPKDEDHHPNSGVFLRGTPGVWWSGYESQIRNEHEPGAPDKPVDFGTGGIYRSQPTRKIVARDGEFFTKTVVANERDFHIWINGFPVTSWHDNRSPGKSVRNQEAVLAAGTISLQSHDPTTNLDFRNLRIAELAKPLQ